MSSLSALRQELLLVSDPAQAAVLSRFFKTGKGEYGEGDRFLGIKVPVQRRLARKYRDLSLADIRRMLRSSAHEERLTGLLILIEQYRKASGDGREEIAAFYLEQRRRVNNWDLVDISAPAILGDYLADRDRSVIFDLARSADLWDRRIAIVATFAFIRKKDFADTFRVAEMLLLDRHDLIRKAVGWMLREVGKRDQEAEEVFLRKHCRTMPRTMLRYAIERFDEEKRRAYLTP